MKPLILIGSFTDEQTGVYIGKAFENLGYKVTGIDARAMTNKLGPVETQIRVLDEVDKVEGTPELILVLKGLELTPNTVKSIKSRFPKTPLVNWFFDIYLQEKPIWDTEAYLRVIPFFDYFFCSVKGVSDKLNEIGYKNARFLDEGCDPELNGEVYLNSFQKRKYGEDIAFIGSIGYNAQHSLRLPLLKIISEEGYGLKVWGKVICEMKHVPTKVRKYLTSIPVINDKHSMVVQSSLLNLGIDGNINMDYGHSARIFRVLCAGGCYVTFNTKGLEKMFKVNKQGQPITGKEEIIVFYNEPDMIKTFDFLLEHDTIREQIAKNGQKKVLDKYTFKHRCKEMIDFLKGDE